MSLRVDAILTKTVSGGSLYRIALELVSVNRWIGRHWRMKHRESQQWERAIRMAICSAAGVRTFPDALYVQCLGTKIRNDQGEKVWVSRCEEKRHVTITRLAPSQRRFIRDDDNLVASCKPLLDALKRVQLIRDDRRKWLDLEVAAQQVSPDGMFWTHVQIERTS